MRPFADTGEFAFNLHDYFESAFTSNPVPLKQEEQTIHIEPTDFGGDKARFAREVVLYGRKSNKILVPARVV